MLRWLERLRGTLRARATPVEAVLYTRRDCPLCDEMKHALAAARSQVPFTLRVVDVDADAALRARHGLRVPVLEIAGREAFAGRVSSAELERELARHARAGAPGAGPEPR
jgi:hypothetical protein